MRSVPVDYDVISDDIFLQSDDDSFPGSEEHFVQSEARSFSEFKMAEILGCHDDFADCRQAQTRLHKVNDGRGGANIHGDEVAETDQNHNEWDEICLSGQIQARGQYWLMKFHEMAPKLCKGR